MKPCPRKPSTYDISAKVAKGRHLIDSKRIGVPKPQLTQLITCSIKLSSKLV